MTPLGAGLHQTNGTWDTEWCFIALRDICVSLQCVIFVCETRFSYQCSPLCFIGCTGMQLALAYSQTGMQQLWLRIPPKPAHPWLWRASSDNEPQTGQSFLHLQLLHSEAPPPSMTPRIPINGSENAGTRSCVSLCYINGLGGAWLRAPLEMGALVLHYGVRSSWGLSVTLCNTNGGATSINVTPSFQPTPPMLCPSPLTLLSLKSLKASCWEALEEIYIILCLLQKIFSGPNWRRCNKESN